MKNLSRAYTIRSAVQQQTCAIVATLTTAVWTEGRELRALRGTASALEIRADLTGDLNPDSLRSHIDGELIYCLRSIESGGAFTGTPEERARRLLAAGQKYDVVDLEADRDLTPEVLSGIPPHRRRICWYGAGRDHVGLASVFSGMAGTAARLYLLAPEATTVKHAIAPLHLLRLLRRSDVTAFATGELGAASRLLAPWLGTPVVFGGLGHNGAHGLLTVERLLNDYPFPSLPPLDSLYGIVGQRVGESHSPRLHNAGYRALGLPALFLPLHANEFTDSWRAMCTEFERLGLPMRAATVVSPYKEEALSQADTVSREATRAGAANLLVHKLSGWRAYTTDPIGVVGAVREAGVWLRGQTVAVVGCGGAGRGAAAGLHHAGVNVTLVNRGSARGRYAARLLGLDFVPLELFEPEQYSLIVHATPIRGTPPFSVDRVRDGTVLVDLAYGPEETSLAAAARRRRLTLVDGWRVLMVEVARQFRLMTGCALPGTTESVESTGGAPDALSRKEFAR
jgi:3-dehydroquinate dehydratase / shikimate dehydrogenase